MIDTNTNERKREWPTREEWAKSRRELGYGWCDDLTFDEPAYGKAEIKDAIQALQALWKAEGIRLRALAVPKGLVQQPGESFGSYYQRYKRMTGTEQELCDQRLYRQSLRKQINRVIKDLQNGNHPYDNGFKEIAEVIKPLTDAWDKARQKALDKRRNEILSTPIDDAAWEKELKNRAFSEAFREAFAREKAVRGPLSHWGEMELRSEIREKLDRLGELAANYENAPTASEATGF